MTQNNGETPRTRRRAGRAAGPPVEETGSAKATETSPAVAEGQPAPQQRASEPTPEPPAADTAKVALTKDAEAAPTAETATVPAAADFLAFPKSGDSPKPARKKPGARRIVAVAASVVLVLALMVGAGVSFYLIHDNSVREDRRTEYLQAARQAVLNLTTIRADSAKEDVDRILATASGKFKTEFDGRVDPFLQIVQQAKVVSNGEIIEAALVRDDENQAVVLVAAKQTLTNAGSNDPQTRFYRFRITVNRTDSGMSASNVEFVA
ncbi:hypothetical protein AB0H76_27255 [Nocardia sp. NPDC050712]|uniref:hypothetical protein n=1 Tax=Nocardia sp. NPDC050712 TaxID=3155518 RepID=UPI0033DAF4A5